MIAHVLLWMCLSSAPTPPLTCLCRMYVCSSLSRIFSSSVEKECKLLWVCGKMNLIMANGWYCMKMNINYNNWLLSKKGNVINMGGGYERWWKGVEIEILLGTISTSSSSLFFSSSNHARTSCRDIALKTLQKEPHTKKNIIALGGVCTHQH